MLWRKENETPVCRNLSMFPATLLQVSAVYVYVCRRKEETDAAAGSTNAEHTVADTVVASRDRSPQPERTRRARRSAPAVIQKGKRREGNGIRTRSGSVQEKMSRQDE